MSIYKKLPKENWELFSILFKRAFSSSTGSLPIASPTKLGCVKIGSGLEMIGETLTCTLTPVAHADDIIFEDFTEQDVQDIFKEGE